MPPASIVLIIQRDPRTSALPRQALRIALGLAAGENPITGVVLMGPAVQLLAEDTDEIVDIDILEKYLPSFGTSPDSLSSRTCRRATTGIAGWICCHGRHTGRGTPKL